MNMMIMKIAYMRNKWLKKCLALCMAVSGLCSCDNFLDTINENTYPAYEALQSIEDLQSTTAYLYTAPWYYFHKQRWIQLGDARANNIYTSSTSNGFSLLGTFNEVNDNTALSHAWGSLYNVVTQAGYIIDDYGPFCVTNGIATQKEVNICLGEAKLMRALAYWYLIMFWHDVPIVDNATTIGSSAYANRFEDVLQYAICQAEFANKWLPMRPYSKGRLSKVSRSEERRVGKEC